MIGPVQINDSALFYVLQSELQISHETAEPHQSTDGRSKMALQQNSITIQRNFWIERNLHTSRAVCPYFIDKFFISIAEDEEVQTKVWVVHC